MRNGRRWLAVSMVSASLFISLALAVRVVGVPDWERALYASVHHVIPPAMIPVSFTVSKLGSERFVFLVGVIILALLPGHLLPRWWLWLSVVIMATWLEDVAKQLIGRPRPVSFRPGFPSGHTTMAAAFYFLLAYFAGRLADRRWHRPGWLLAAVFVIVVAFSRIVLHAHWPLDTVGGAALGLMVAALAISWHECHPSHAAPGRRSAWIIWLHRWQGVVVLPFHAVLLLTPPFVGEDSPLDLACDLLGIVVIGAGVLLRMWAIGQAGFRQREGQPGPPLIASGPYAYVRHPIYIGNGIIGIGIGLIAENALAMAVIPSIIVILYRLIVPAEEARLRERFGVTYDAYCADVPRWLPRAAPRRTPKSDPWVCAAVRRDYRAVVTTAVLAAGAQFSESLPHLLR